MLTKITRTSRYFNIKAYLLFEKQIEKKLLISFKL